MRQVENTLPTPNLVTLRDLMVDEIFKAVNLSPHGWARHRFGHLFHPPTERFAEVGYHFDRIVATSGFQQGAAWVLSRFASHVSAIGTQSIPKDGPLLIVSNHPGTYDALAIACQIPRDDLRIIVGGIPYLAHLPNAVHHFIFAPRNPIGQRMLAIRHAIRHLSSGGALLIFPSGHIDPDPDVMPGAESCLDEWSYSLPIMLRKVPSANVLVSIVSGVLAKEFVRHPLAWVRKKTQDRQRIMEFMQVIHQLLHPGKLMLSPKVSFAESIQGASLGNAEDTRQGLAPLIQQARQLLISHPRIHAAITAKNSLQVEADVPSSPSPH